MYYIINYVSEKGGVNNVQICTIYSSTFKSFELKTFKSRKMKAVEYAEKFITNNYGTRG